MLARFMLPSSGVRWLATCVSLRRTQNDANAIVFLRCAFLGVRCFADLLDFPWIVDSAVKGLVECSKAACLQALDQAGNCKRKREHLTWVRLLIISRGRAPWLLFTIGQFCIEVVLGLRIVPLPPFQFRLNQGLIAILLIPLELLCRICSGERATIIFVS